MTIYNLNRFHAIVFVTWQFALIFALQNLFPIFTNFVPKWRCMSKNSTNDFSHNCEIFENCPKEFLFFEEVFYSTALSKQRPGCKPNLCQQKPPQDFLKNEAAGWFMVHSKIATRTRERNGSCRTHPVKAMRCLSCRWSSETVDALCAPSLSDCWAFFPWDVWPLRMRMTNSRSTPRWRRSPGWKI